MNKQQIISKYGKKFAGSAKSSPVLEGIHYAADGSAVVTDRHYMLRVKDAHIFQQPVTLHAKTGMPIDRQYPDTSKIWPNYQNDQRIDLAGSSLKDVATRIRCVADVASRINKKSPVATIETESGSAWVHVKDELSQVQAKAFLGNTVDPKLQLKVSLNAEYLHTALSVFVDSLVSELQIQFDGALRPILLTDSEAIDIVILPYRTNH